MRQFESCQYRSTDVILWHTDNSVHTRVVKAIDSNCPVFFAPGTRANPPLHENDTPTNIATFWEAAHLSLIHI